MKLVYDNNEKINPESAVYLLLMLVQDKKTEEINYLIDNHIDNLFTLFDHIKRRHGYYLQQEEIIRNCEKLSKLNNALVKMEASFEERMEATINYKEEITTEIKRGGATGYVYSSLSVPNPAYETFILDLDVDISLFIRKSRIYNFDIKYAYKYIFEPVMDGKIKLDSKVRTELFEYYMSILFYKVTSTQSTNFHLNSIKSMFCVSESLLQMYMKIYDFFRINFEEYKCQQFIEKERFELFCKKFNKWVCSSLIK